MPPSPPQIAADQDVEAKAQQRQSSLWHSLHLRSRQLLYQLAMRGGGEAFGAPFEPGVPTLTERVVKTLKQRGFFAFETCERLGQRQHRNRFTRHGAARYRGPYLHGVLPAVAGSRVQRLLAFMRDQTLGRARLR